MLIATSLSIPAGPMQTLRVGSVLDGEAIAAIMPDKGQVKIRLGAIDTPELGQPFSQTAKKILSEKVFSKDVLVVPRERTSGTTLPVEIARPSFRLSELPNRPCTCLAGILRPSHGVFVAVQGPRTKHTPRTPLVPEGAGRTSFLWPLCFRVEPAERLILAQARRFLSE